ncbi:hypothetical protein PybrP1_009582 [[Pythium] brassicae (nom. inval.)]|nr:hypothetical protein PybrP1_009582 [[Pythium] brassicae (nom. inval.)]
MAPQVTPAGAAFLATIVLAGWSGVLLLLSPAFVLLVLPPLAEPLRSHARALYRRVTRLKLFGLQVRVWGDAAAKAHEPAMAAGESALWFANHRTRIDWMLLWSVLLRTRTLDRVRIVLKAPLRALPVFGWAMQHFVFVFLQRKWADDQRNLATLLPFLARTEPETSYLLFPEGTDLSPANAAKNAAFAETRGLAPRRHSLYPRTTGWAFMFPLLRANLRAVYDVTLFYVDHAAGERPSELALLAGRTPRTLHVYIERVAIDDVGGRSGDKADDDDEAARLAAWMEARFARKETLLQAFYEDGGRLPEGAQPLFAEQESTMTAQFALIAAFWVVWVALAAQLGWALGWFGFLGAGGVALAYALSTAFTVGVDGFQVA